MQNEYFNTKQKKENYRNKFKNKQIKNQHTPMSKSKKIATFISVMLILSSITAITGYSIYEKYKLEKEPIFTIQSEDLSFNISKLEMSFYYNTLTNDFISTYKNALSYLDLDVSTPLSEQTCYFDKTLTWHEYFEKSSIELIIEKKSIAEEANKNGFKYETEEEDYNSFCENIKTEAKNNNMTVNEYLSFMYMDNATLKSLKPYIIEYYKSKKYIEFLFNKDNISETEINEYYELNKNNYDTVSYRIFEINAEITSNDDNETKTKKMQEAKDLATEFFNQVYDEESFKELCVKYSSEAQKESYKKNDLSLCSEKKYSEISGSYSAWLFDQSREEKQTVIIEDSTNNKYYILYFINRKQDEQSSVNIRHILITPEISNKTNYMASEEDKENAYKKAEDILNEWISNGQTEEYFALLANKHSQDTGSNSNGGLYEYVIEGQMGLENFDSWLFDDKRKDGDYDIVETEYGYHIMYFVKRTEPIWKLQIRNEIIVEKTEAYIKSLTEKYSIVDIENNISYLHNHEKTIEENH